MSERLEVCPYCRQPKPARRIIRWKHPSGKHLRFCPECAKEMVPILRTAVCPACTHAADVLERAAYDVEQIYAANDSVMQPVTPGGPHREGCPFIQQGES